MGVLVVGKADGADEKVGVLEGAADVDGKSVGANVRTGAKVGTGHTLLLGMPCSLSTCMRAVQTS